MSEQLITLATNYGIPFLALIVFLSCLALPVPCSFVMLMSGSLVTSGDLAFTPVFAAAYGAALAGDQAGFFAGRIGGRFIIPYIKRTPARRDLLEKAQNMLERRGNVGVFLTRWLFSPLGPYVNLITGAADMRWWKFSLPAALGELVWVSLYIGLGMVFSENILMIANIASSVSGMLAAGAITAFLGWQIWKQLAGASKRHSRRTSKR
ncbi:DedA family protein [Rhizobium sp. PAMB 3182]